MNDINPINLLTLLNSYGDVVELNQKLDSDQVIKELEQLEWEKGPNGKQGTHQQVRKGLDLKIKTNTIKTQQ